MCEIKKEIMFLTYSKSSINVENNYPQSFIMIELMKTKAARETRQSERSQSEISNVGQKGEKEAE